MALKSWVAKALGLGLVAATAPMSHGQGLYPPAPGADLEQVSRRMAEAVRDLAEDVTNQVGQDPNGQYLVRDVQELQRSTSDWFGSLRGRTDPYQVRRSYSGIDVSWHRLRGQLSAPGVANAAVVDEIRRVERADATLHQALHLNDHPANFEGQAPPTGLDETKRLAFTLAQGGERLAAVIQASYGNDPNAAPLVNDVTQLARQVDDFYASLNNPAGTPPQQVVQQSFIQIVEKSNAFGLSLGAYSFPPPVRTSWDGYTTVHNLLRANLGLANLNIGVGTPVATQEVQQVQQVGIPYNPNPNPPLGQWADGLDRQVDELIANFAPQAIAVPEGREMLGDLERLRHHVRDFRGDVARNFDTGRLAFEFREVDADWQRLARRVNRVAQGRTNPNIQRFQQIGQTCEQIHGALGMPGYPPTIQPN